MFTIGDFAALGRVSVRMLRHYDGIGQATPDISPVIQPLYPELFRQLEAAHICPTGPGLAWYEPAGEGEAVRDARSDRRQHPGPDRARVGS
ncbi:hypothetical protein [Micromonospora sp. NBC_00898]|uniref:hypothetical protein n=1 Tax=Micromonospora sp. NBC_00898 TaxID=2975981 RepID=UPI0038641E95